MRGFVAWIIALTPLQVASDEAMLRIDLLYGHPVYHAQTREAGIAMGLTISAHKLAEPCERLRAAANLANEAANGSPLQVLFVLPHKSLLVEGYYFGDLGRAVLVAGQPIPRSTLDRIMLRAGIPPALLDETNVELEISCWTNEPRWVVVWYDVRRIGDQELESVIESARQRFMTIYDTVVEHSARDRARP